MTEMSVWAPAAHQLELESRGRRMTMTCTPGGWWTASVPYMAHGTDYAFYVDDDGPFPDPRSPWQPQGVNGPSRWVDHDRFDWSDAGWQQPPLGSAIIYELHIGTFTPNGSFESAIDRLAYLVDLGVTHVELMPVAEFPGNRGWGYDGVDLYAPHHGYGGPEGLKRFVNACHERGLAVIQDVVYNHLGPSGNYLGRFGPYFTRRYATPWGEAVNLDGSESDEVRRFFIDNGLMWLRDYHMDGLRIDAVHAMVDTSAIHFLEQLTHEVTRLQTFLGRHLVLIAESDLNDPRVVRPREVGGYGLDAQWNEDFHHALHALLTGEQDGYYQDFGQVADLARVLTYSFLNDGRYSPYRRRCHGRPAKDLSGDRFVGCLQNHDQVGNRALGERTSHLLSQGRLKIGAALVLTAPFLPMIFQGEEWAASTPFLYFTDHQDPELGEAVKRGRQEEFAAFGWEPDKIPDPQAEETFFQSRLDWNELAEPVHQELWKWHQALIQLRRRNPELTDGRMENVSVRFDEAARWLLVKRESIWIAVNLGLEKQRVPCPEAGRGDVLLSSKEELSIDENALWMPAQSVVIGSRPESF